MTAQIVQFPHHRSPGVRVLVTKRELAARWGVSERWIELRQRHDDLPVEKDGPSRLVRYNLGDVEAWREARRAG